MSPRLPQGDGPTLRHVFTAYLLIPTAQCPRLIPSLQSLSGHLQVIAPGLEGGRRP